MVAFNPQNVSSLKLLQGRYEAERLPADFSPERIVPDFAFNVLNPIGLLYRPVVDEQALKADGQRPSWPDGRSFAVCLTHDVDHVSAHSIRQGIRTVRAAWPKKRLTMGPDLKLLFFGGLQCVRGAAARGKDPLHCYERWIEVESGVGARSTFFFLPERVAKSHYTDGTYRFSDIICFDGQRCTVAEMICELDHRGWEIGLHATWYAFDDADELKRQKVQLEQVIGHEIESVRQHYLHYDIRITPRVHSEAGFSYDTTLGFNDNIGFRFGTSYPWYLYDLHEEKQLAVMEIPLIVQDGALLNTKKGLRVDQETAFQYVVQMATAVEAVGGVLTLLWHPNAVADETSWNLYIRILDYLKDRNAWFASVRDIGKWWVRNSSFRYLQ